MKLTLTMRKQYPDIDTSWFYDEPGEGIAGYYNQE